MSEASTTAEAARRGLQFISAALLLGWLVGSSAYGGAIRHPCAAAIGSDGILYLVIEGGGVYRLAGESEELEAVVPRVGPYRPADIVVLKGEPDQLLVIGNWLRGTGSSLSKLRSYSTRGQQTAEWTLPFGMTFTGATFDEKGRIAYLARGNDASIYRVDLNGAAEGSLVVRIPGIRAVGAIAFDASRGEVLAAAPYDGTVHSINPTSKESRIVASDLGEVFALGVDEAIQRLYAADSSTGRVWAIDLSRSPATKVEFLRSEHILDPLGLAVAGDGSVWLADRHDGSLLRVSRSGSVLRRVGKDHGRYQWSE